MSTPQETALTPGVKLDDPTNLIWIEYLESDDQIVSRK